VRELVDDVEHPEPPSIVRPVLDEVVGPDVVAMLGPQPDARSVRKPEPSAFGLLPGDLQPLASPDPLDTLVVHEPACSPQKRADLAIAIAAVLAGEPVGRRVPATQSHPVRVVDWPARRVEAPPRVTTPAMSAASASPEPPVDQGP
jgi:hypothetical protein